MLKDKLDNMLKKKNIDPSKISESKGSEKDQKKVVNDKKKEDME